MAGADLGLLVGVEGDEGLARGLARALERDELASFRTTLCGGLAGIPWNQAADAIVASAPGLLATGLFDTFLKVWSDAGIFKKYLEKGKYDPNEDILIPLADHSIHSRHEPYLEVRLNDAPVGRLEAEIVLELALRGVILKVRDARIRSVQAGTVKASGEFRVRGVRITGIDRTITLPGTIDLGDGIPIAP